MNPEVHNNNNNFRHNSICASRIYFLFFGNKSVFLTVKLNCSHLNIRWWKASDSFFVRTSKHTIPKSTNNQSISKSRKTRSLLKYWNSFDPARIHFGTRDFHSRNEQQQRIFSPMASLWKAMQNQSQVMVMTRGLKEPRASLIGNLVAFDRYWNLILENVIEYSVNLPKSALKGYGKPGRSKKRREQRLRTMQRNNQTLFQSKQCPSIQTLDQLNHDKPLEIGQLFPYQYDDYDPDEIIGRDTNNEEINKLKPFHLLGKSPLSDDINDGDDNQSILKCNQINKSVLANVHNHSKENTSNYYHDKSSNWTASMVHLNERNMSELSDISLWYSLQTNRKHPLTEKQHNVRDNKVCSDDGEQQLFIRGANVILVRIISDKQ
ncbi:unnamed protein product [Schistosoma turkestanicum]|nr:unnamed protein product [Schistosoma turkestanicum]